MPLPLSHVLANCIVFPPQPQNASIITFERHRSAVNAATFSGVTENQLSARTQKIGMIENIFIRLSIIFVNFFKMFLKIKKICVKKPFQAVLNNFTIAN